MGEDSIFSRFRGWVNEGSGKLVGVLIALAVLGGAVAVWVTRSDSSQAQARRLEQMGFKAFYYCPACKASGQTVLKKGQGFPIPCPQCKKPAVRGVQCAGRCGKIIENVQSSYWACPNCGYIYDFRLQPYELPPGDSGSRGK